MTFTASASAMLLLELSKMAKVKLKDSVGMLSDVIKTFPENFGQR